MGVNKNERNYQFTMEVKDISKHPRMSEVLPPYDAIPEEFKNFNSREKWNKFVNDVFFCGIKDIRVIPKEGIDVNKALQHVMYCLRSFEPAHEHKTAGCAYLMSCFFEDISYAMADNG